MAMYKWALTFHSVVSQIIVEQGAQSKLPSDWSKWPPGKPHSEPQSVAPGLQRKEKTIRQPTVMVRIYRKTQRRSRGAAMASSAFAEALANGAVYPLRAEVAEQQRRVLERRSRGAAIASSAFAVARSRS